MLTRSILLTSLLALGAGSVYAACYKVPYTNRRQFKVIPNSVMRGLGRNTYSSMLQGVNVQKSGANHAVLQQVGARLSKAANQSKFDWQFRMIDEPTVNAWCLPGGYIGFYTGILPILQNEAGMAFVMGHEVAHATAHHGAERLSQNLAIVGGLGAIQAAATGSGKLSRQQTEILMGALGVGAQVGVLLPFSRRHESEADVIGLMYMATAGYPPEESVQVWDRMASATGGGSGPAFLATHPPHERRQKKLREWMPRAQKRYQRHRLSGDMQATLWSGPIPSGGASAPSSGGTRESDTGGGDSGERSGSRSGSR